jgi:Protein of unknown function (DUF1350)
MQDLNIEQSFKFSPISFSWVAIHPKPKGVVQFIGGAFFGTFPNIFYRYFLKQIFLEGYTVVALPFRFTFRHWSVAISLLREQETLRLLLAQRAKELGYDPSIYGKSSSYQWIGHSLGCKYIALLELLAEWSQDTEKVRRQIKRKTKKSDDQLKQIKESVKGLSISIKDQASLLMAPDISNTQDAIKVPLLPEFLDAIGLGVLPTKQETFDLIEESALFNLAKMISFDRDKIAGNLKAPLTPDNTVRMLIKILGGKLLYEEVEGKHLRPLGLELGDSVVGPIAPPPHNLVPLVLKFLTLKTV